MSFRKGEYRKKSCHKNRNKKENIYFYKKKVLAVDVTPQQILVIAHFLMLLRCHILSDNIRVPYNVPGIHPVQKASD